MKNFIISACLFLITFTASAQDAFTTQKPVICDSTIKIVTALKEQWNEELAWYGKDAANDSRYALFINPKTNTWTLLQMSPETACVLGVGNSSNIAKVLGI